jgi:tetratricopeptide (TPR) repeat protein
MMAAGERLRSIMERPLTRIAVIIIVAIIGYANTFQVPFYFDDQSSITDTPAIHSLSSFFGKDGGYDFLPNRVVGYLTFALNYHAGGENVVGYHVFNLLIHIMNGLLVYALVRLTLRTPFIVGLGTGDWGLTTQNSKLKTQNFIPFFAALLFVSHPIQTQAVTYIVQRLTSMATFFYLAALVCHVRWRLARQAGAQFVSRPVLPWWLLSLSWAVLAMKTKEIAFTLPLTALLYEFAFFGRPRLRRLPELAPLLLTLAIIPLTMLNILKPAGEVLSDVSKATVAQSALTRWEYLCTQFNVIVTYLRLLLFPVNQNLDYDFPVSRSLMEPRTFLSLLLLISLLGFAVWLWQTRNSPQSPLPGPRSRLISFGIFWFFLTLAVESGIIPIADVIVEHRLYLPSVGFFLALAAGGSLLAEKLKLSGRTAGVVLTGVVLLLTGATYSRNEVWRDWITLWSDTARKSPNNPRAFNCLGVGYQRQNHHEEAIREFLTSIRIFPGYAEGYYNLGVSYQALGRNEEAVSMYERSVALGLDAPQAFSNLGVNYASQGRFAQAVDAFTEAVRRAPDNIVMRRNLAGALMQQGRLAEAEREYHIVLRLSPGDPKALRFLREITGQMTK